MIAGCGITNFDGLFSHLLKLRIRRTTNALRVREGFGQVGLGEAEKFRIVKIVKLLLLSF